MPTTFRNTADNAIIHQNNFVATDFNAPNLVEVNKTISLPYAEGKLSQWIFDGISISYNNWTYSDYVETALKTDLDVVHLHFNLRGKIYMEHSSLGKNFTLNSYQHNIFYSNGFEGIIKNGELTSETFIIQITKAVFFNLIKDANYRMKNFADQILEGKPISISENNLYIDLLMHNAIKNIVQCKYEPGLKKMFFFSKCIELLVLQSEAFGRSTESKKLICKTDYDKERILFARNYLIQNADMPPSLSELAMISGINEFKLKAGFKELFNNTVFGYLSDYRLEEAKNELTVGQKTATEIAFELGYSSLQHFSTAFKKKFGVSPKGRG
jgi:AraC family transcriptional activator of pyochelin receptor